MSTSENNQYFAVVPQILLEKIESHFSEIKTILREKSEAELNGQYVESVQIPKILGISRKTWQTYRDKRLVPFSQIGSKIYVKRSDLDKFMNDHYIEAKQ